MITTITDVLKSSNPPIHFVLIYRVYLLGVDKQLTVIIVPFLCVFLQSSTSMWLLSHIIPRITINNCLARYYLSHFFMLISTRFLGLRQCLFTVLTVWAKNWYLNELMIIKIVSMFHQLNGFCWAPLCCGAHVGTNIDARLMSMLTDFWLERSKPDRYCRKNVYCNTRRKGCDQITA